MGHAARNFAKLTVAGLLADGAGARVGDSRSGVSFLNLLLRRASDSIATEACAVSDFRW
jgi:hypothetical protein